MSKNRVVVTGCGVVCGLGSSFAGLTAALRTGRSGVRIVAAGTGPRSYVAASPLEDDEEETLSATEQALYDPITRHAMRAGQEAIEQSGVLTRSGVLRNAAVYFGTALGGIATMEDAYRDIWYHGTVPKPLAIVCGMSNAAASHLSIRFEIAGPNITYAVACASSSIAIGEAFHAIRAGRFSCALAGGAEACVTPGVIRAWQVMRLLAAVDRAAPAETCRPFSKDRGGVVLGEGAAMFVLEEMDAAVARGATILCELVGYGTNTDGTHVCIPDSEGQANAISQALADANLAPEEIDYLNAHGTATRAGDITETRAIRAAFGMHANALPISSTKSVHGHLLGASGALELAVCIAALNERFIPATMHLREPDEDCDLDLDFVPNQPRVGVEVRRVMSSSFAFGGSNAVLIAARAE